MKLIKKWVDKNYSATNYFYEYPNKTRLLITVKADIKDVVIDAVLKAGSYFEKQVGVPYGTSHFLEHILTNPNRVLKTLEEQTEYRFGNRTRPAVFYNASTSLKLMYFYCYGHPKGALRMIDYIRYELDYPLERIKEFIEKERNIIKAEIERNYKKEEDDQGFQLNRFLLEDFQKEFSRRNIGTQESVDSINEQHLVKFYKKMFKSDNLIISIQAAEFPNQKTLDKLKELAYSLPEDKSNPKVTEGKPESKYVVEHFKEPGYQGVFTSFNYYQPFGKEPEYRKNVLDFFLQNIISDLGFKILREKEGLVYSLEGYRYYASWKYQVKGYKLAFEKAKFAQTMESLYRLFNKDIEEFLQTDEGNKWFESQVSKYIFTRTKNYDGEYSEGIIVDWVIEEGIYLYDYFESVKVAKTLTKEDLIKHVKALFDQPPRVWLVSDFDADEIKAEFKKSSFHKKFKKLSTSSKVR